MLFHYIDYYVCYFGHLGFNIYVLIWLPWQHLYWSLLIINHTRLVFLGSLLLLVNPEYSVTSTDIPVDKTSNNETM